MVFFLGLFMRVLIPCLFSSPVFALFFSFPLNSTFVCCLPPSCAYLAFQILLPLTESHLPNAITLPSPFRLFFSSLVTLIDAGLCLGYLITQQLWELSGAIWGESITPIVHFPKKHWIFHLPSPHSPTSPLLLATKLRIHFPGSWSSIKKCCCWVPKECPKFLNLKDVIYGSYPVEKISFSWILSPRCSHHCVLCRWLSMEVTL